MAKRKSYYSSSSSKKKKRQSKVKEEAATVTEDIETPQDSEREDEDDLNMEVAKEEEEFKAPSAKSAPKKRASSKEKKRAFKTEEDDDDEIDITSRFFGDPVPADEAKRLWPQRYEGKCCNSGERDGGTSGTPPGANVKRKHSWLLGDFITEEDQYNKRDAHGVLVPLSELPKVQGGPEEAWWGKDMLDEETDAIPNGLIKVFTEVQTINGSPFYNAEANALGLLNENAYLLIPANYELPVCEVKNVGLGVRHFKVRTDTLGAIYHLAKEQAKDLKLNDANQIRWALLRMEAVNAGWFENQKHVKRVAMKGGFVQTLITDWPEAQKICNTAWSLCGFIPFIIEYCFRAFASSYTKSSAGEYSQRAEKLARSAQMGDILTYMDHEILFTQAFRWIGVKRVKDVLIANKDAPRIPNIFRVRAKSAPAGQAVVTTSYAIIEMFKSVDWWKPIAQVADYEETNVEATAKKILEDPWKYHILSGAYGCAPLTADEIAEVEEARGKVIRYAPILQAFCETLLVGTELGKAKALKKYAEANVVQFNRAKQFFIRCKKLKCIDLESMFITELFKPKKIVAEIAGGMNDNDNDNDNANANANAGDQEPGNAQ